MAKRLVVCCDGTWNDSDNGNDFTNVVRLAWAIEPQDARAGNIAQIVYYQSGVGTGSDLLGKLGGGGVGLGLSRNVRDAYAFLANNYARGDEIFLFGFSRGAYTARSIGGLIGYAGLLHKRDMDRFSTLWEGYRLRDKVAANDPRGQFADRQTPVSIKCVGVWDTVGALGVPGHLDKLFTSFYEFHDTGLGAHVENAFHALALDETRDDFKPTLWVQDDANRQNGQMLTQVWFAGVHSNIGGGYVEHGLSDIALAWMASEVSPFLALDFDYLKARRDLRNPWSFGMLYDSAGPAWELLGTSPRTPFQYGANTNETIHASVPDRANAGANAVPGVYHCAALNGVDNLAQHLGVLSDTESTLKWTELDVRPPTAEQKTVLSPAGFLLKTLGGG